MNDFVTYFGRTISGTTSPSGRYSVTSGSATIDSTTLYDALDVFFREGGVNAYVSLNALAGSPTTSTTVATAGSNVLTAQGAGTWPNSASGSSNGLIIKVTCVATNQYVASVNFNGNNLAVSPTLGGDVDIRNWINSLPKYQSMCTAAVATTAVTLTTTSGSPTATFTGTATVAVGTAVTGSVPANTTIASIGSTVSGTTTVTLSANATGSSAATTGTPASVVTPLAVNASVSFYFSATSSSDGTGFVATVDSALAFFTEIYGVGQVSAPGITTDAAYLALTNHAANFNRVALLDASPTNAVNTITASVTTLQSAALDPSYSAMFSPWLVVPGIITSNPSASYNQVFNRTVAPSALAAAKMAVVDQYNDCNVPAAGVGIGSSAYAVNLTTNYVANDRATLNTAGVSVIRNVPNAGVIAIYGFRSCASDQNWVYLNNVRFRMQIIRDFDLIAENFLFDEIDGRGQIFARLNGALAGQCQSYWTRRSIYGSDPSLAFQVNTGVQVNTPSSIAAGQINAVVNLRMSPFGEFVSVAVNKYLASAALPVNNNQPLTY
jgi:hypothetical protein